MVPKIDHHVGKVVQEVNTEGAVWNIVLEDGTVITSHVKSKKPAVEELRLMVVESINTKSGKKFNLHFGKPNADEKIVVVEEGKYEINGVDPWQAQIEATPEPPPDPSEERVQDGPEGGWEALREREKAVQGDAEGNGEG